MNIEKILGEHNNVLSPDPAMTSTSADQTPVPTENSQLT